MDLIRRLDVVAACAAVSHRPHLSPLPQGDDAFVGMTDFAR